MPNNQTRSTRVSTTRIIVVLLTLVSIYFVAAQFTELNTMLSLVANSSWVWLGVAIIAMVLTFVISALVQYIAGDSTGRLSHLLALGFAGSFLNHFLPFSIGGVGLLAEYYRKLGQPRSQSIVTATAPLVIGAVTTILVALIISPVTVIELAHNVRDAASSRAILLIVVVVLGSIVFLSVVFRNKIKEKAVEAVAGLRGIRGFQQMAKVAVGSILMSLVAAFVLYASIHAIHADVSFIVVLTLFIVSLLVSEVSPSPGGLGATEAVLILGLTGAGLSASQAVAATLVFRFITFLLPIIPGAIAFTRLDRLQS